jgi:hypothetical protein
MCSVSSLRGSELVIGKVWGGECGARDGPVWGLCRCRGGVFRGAGALIKRKQGSVL